MVVLRGLGLSRISVPIPIGRSSREKVQTQHKKFARHLSPCMPLAPHHTDLKPVFVAASEAWRCSSAKNAPQPPTCRMRAERGHCRAAKKLRKFFSIAF